MGIRVRNFSAFSKYERDCIRRNANALFFYVIASYREQQESESRRNKDPEDPLCRIKKAIDRACPELWLPPGLALIIAIEKPNIVANKTAVAALLLLTN